MTYTPVSQEFDIKNTIAGTDAYYKDGRLSILDTENGFPQIWTKGITNAPYFTKSLQEILQARTYTFVAAVNTVYSVDISQTIKKDGSRTTKKISFDSTGTSATNAVILAGLIASANNLGLEITAAGASATSFTVTAKTGYATFYESGLTNLTVASAQTTYAPSGTASAAITTVIAPASTAADRISGTNVVTVETAAAHLLRPGDYVQIATTTGFLMTYTDNVPLSNNTDFGKTFSGAIGGKFRVATVPTSTTFTLDGVTGNGGTNTGACTINTINVAFLTTLGSETIATGKTLNVVDVATMTVASVSSNDTVGTAGTSGSFRVGVGGTGTRFLIEGINTNGSLNSGTITITEVAQNSRFTYNDLTNLIGQPSAISGDTYSTISFTYSESDGNFVGSNGGMGKFVSLYVNESQTASSLFMFNLYKALESGNVR